MFNVERGLQSSWSSYTSHLFFMFNVERGLQRSWSSYTSHLFYVFNVERGLQSFWSSYTSHLFYVFNVERELQSSWSSYISPFLCVYYREGTTEFLEQLHLTDLVDLVVCGDDPFSISKPDPHNARYATLYMISIIHLFWHNHTMPGMQPCPYPPILA